MTTPPPDASFENENWKEELRGLAEARLQGTATETELRRLEHLMVADPRAADFFVSLHWIHAGMSLVADENPAIAVVRPPQTVQREKKRSSLATVGAALALLLICGLSVFLFTALPERPTRPSILAWLESRDADLGRSSLFAGDRIRRSDGTTTIVFRNGVSLTLSGAGELELIDDKNVYLHSGQVGVDVGPEGNGFTVQTPSTKVVDLGTEFGVSVPDSNETNVVVFSGQIRLEKETHPEADLFRGEGMKVSSTGRKTSLQKIWQTPTGRDWSLERLLNVKTPILAVSDNREDGTCTKYYGIVPGGFGEDALAYVDRTYEWNSLPGHPFPQELIGADYIRTFNDTKFASPLAIELTLSEPCVIYVLFDPRHHVPNWLEKDFERTEIQLGLDLGRTKGPFGRPAPPPGITATRFLGVGPGQSVDIPFVVWKREIFGPQHVTLGPNGDRSDELLSSEVAAAGSMYGIVVARRNAQVSTEPNRPQLSFQNQ